MSMLFVLTLLMVMSVALVLFLNQQLDTATAVAARQVLNGTVQKAGYGSADFRTNSVCAALPAAFSCPDVIINLQTVDAKPGSTGYYAFVTSGATGLVLPALTNNTPQYSPGVQGSYEYLQILYPITFLPAIVTRLLSNQTYNGAPAYLAVATAAFRNEQY